MARDRDLEDYHEFVVVQGRVRIFMGLCPLSAVKGIQPSSYSFFSIPWLADSGIAFAIAIEAL